MRTPRFNPFCVALAALGINILPGCESGSTTEIPACYTANSDGSRTPYYASAYDGDEDAAIAACEAAAVAQGGAATVPTDTSTDTDGDGEDDTSITFDVDTLIQSLEAFGGLYDRMLGVHTDLVSWNPASSDTCYVGYNAVGGSEDWLPEHCVLYVDEILEIDADSDGIADARFAAVEFDESTQPYLGNLLNVGNADCWDTTGEYYTLDGCWAKIYVVGGEEFTAWVSSGSNLGDYQLSVESNSRGLESGPDNGI